MSAKADGMKTAHGQIVLHQQLCVPACRLAVVSIWKDQHENPEDATAEIQPVVALASVLLNDYQARVPESASPPRMGATHREMLDNGWRLDWLGGTADIDPVVIDDEYGLIRLGHPLLCSPWRRRIVACTWPPEEDEQRLRAVAEGLRRDGTGTFH